MYTGSGGKIKSNKIGTNLLGTQAIGNLGYGIRVVFATGVIIGGDDIDDGGVEVGVNVPGHLLIYDDTTGTNEEGQQDHHHSVLQRKIDYFIYHN